MACGGRAGCPGLVHLPSIPYDIVPLCGSLDYCIVTVVIISLSVAGCFSAAIYFCLFIHYINNSKVCLSFIISENSKPITFFPGPKVCITIFCGVCAALVFPNNNNRNLFNLVSQSTMNVCQCCIIVQYDNHSVIPKLFVSPCRLTLAWFWFFLGSLGCFCTPSCRCASEGVMS